MFQQLLCVNPVIPAYAYMDVGVRAKQEPEPRRESSENKCPRSGLFNEIGYWHPPA